MDSKESEDENYLYNNLPDFKYDNTIDELKTAVAKLEADNQLLRQKLTEVEAEKKAVESDCNVLKSNISSLMKTAKLEIRRKDKTIAELRDRMKGVRYDSRSVGTKRRCTPGPSPSKRPRLSENRSPEKHRLKELIRGNTSDRRETVSVEQAVKPIVPTKDVTVTELPPLESDSTRAGLTAVNKAPVFKPAFIGPTLFSARMCRRLQNLDATPPQAAAPSFQDNTNISRVEHRSEVEEIQASSGPTRFTEGHRAEASTNQVVASEPLPTSNQQAHTVVHNPGNNNPDSSSIVSIKCSALLESANSSTKEIASSKTELPIQIQFKSADYNSAPLVCSAEEIMQRLRSNVTIPTEVKLPVSVSSSSASSDRNSRAGNLDVPQAIVKVPDNRNRIRLRSSSNNRLALNGKWQKSNAVDETQINVTNVESVSKDDGVKKARKPPGIHKNLQKTVRLPVTPNSRSSIDKPSKSTPKETKSMTARNMSTARTPTERKVDSPAKGPTSAFKLKTCQKRMFSPISNQWKLPAPSESAKKCDEIPTNIEVRPEAVSTTTELNVRVEETKTEKSLAESMFGSPVKWADSSSDSITEPANSRTKTIYNIFGSSLKCLDGSTEQSSAIVLTQAAYEDSNTLQVNEKPSTPRPAPAFELALAQVSSQTGLLRSATKNDDLSRDDSRCSASQSGSAHSVAPQNDTRTSVASAMLEGKSLLGSAGVFGLRNQYGDSVIGQFDDTAQFVSALAKVDTELSPLSTPVKHLDVSNELTSENLNIPTSFKEAFQTKAIKEGTVCTTVGQSVCSHIEALSSSPSTLANKFVNPEPMNPPAKVESLVVAVRVENAVKIGATNARPKPIVFSPEPTNIPSPKFIHRSNFSSSSVFSLNSSSQSNFADKPLNVLQPRKVPRPVSRGSLNRSPHKGGKDHKLNPRIAINDSFITEQEVRVHWWRKNNLYESIVLSPPRTSSPNRTASPNAKRQDSSPRATKRAVKKPASPNKTATRSIISEMSKVINSQTESTDLAPESTSSAGNVNSLGIPSKESSLPKRSVPKNQRAPGVEVVEKPRDSPRGMSLSLQQTTKQQSEASEKVDVKSLQPNTKPKSDETRVASEAKPVVIIKRQRRNSDFKRSSALKSGADALEKLDISRLCVPFVSRVHAPPARGKPEANPAQQSSEGTGSKPVVIKRRNYRLENSVDAGWNVQHTSLEGSLLDKTQLLETTLPGLASTTTLRCSSQTVNEERRWILRPVEIASAEATYEFITSSFSPLDPRARPTRKDHTVPVCTETSVVPDSKKIDAIRPQREISTPEVAKTRESNMHSVVPSRTPRFATSTPRVQYISNDSFKTKSQRNVPNSPKENIADRASARQSKSKYSHRASTRRRATTPRAEASRRRYNNSRKMSLNISKSSPGSDIIKVVRENRNINLEAMYSAHSTNVVILPGRRKASFGASN